MRRPRPLLAATLIVRDEAHQLTDCLASLDGVVDEVVVYDTGSRDGTPDVARHAGARVLQGYWDDDFARARNAALEMTRALWALIVDADERLVADGPVLRAVLAGHVPGQSGPVAGPGLHARLGGLILQVVCRGVDGRFQAGHASVRVVRTDGARWEGRVHEVLRFGRPDLVRVQVAADVARLDHLGYRDADTVRAKAERNLAIAQAELDHLVASRSHDVATGARVLFDLARSALEVGQRQRAVDALETLREIAPEGPHRRLATGLLAQILLDVGGFEQVALALEAELRADPRVDRRFTAWIRAQALAGLDRREEALELLRGIDRLVDHAGVEQPFSPVLRARAVLAARAGHLAEARAALCALEDGIEVEGS
ncbi:MAG TPA: glycosyltransferase [Kineosporiaceae bacterium]